MDIAIEKLVGLVIFLIILLVLIIFLLIPEALGKDIGLQNDLRNCCRAYVTRGCPEFTYSVEIAYIACSNDRNLADLVNQYNMDYNSLRSFCECP